MPKQQVKLYNMGMPHRKDREFTEEEKTIFRAGVSEGEERMKYRLKLFEATNSHLRRELERLEAYDPLVYVKVLPDEVPQIVGLLKIAGKAKGVSSEKRKLVRKLVRSLNSRLKLAQVIEIGEGKEDEG